MYKKLLLTTILSLNIYAYSDADMDGIEDANDKCPGTSLTELVDANGCTIENLESPHSFSVIFGVNYSQNKVLETTDTITESLQVGYSYKDFSLQASSSYYSSESNSFSDSGINDSYIGASYTINAMTDLSLTLSGGVLLPTYKSDLNNNNVDYSASLSFSYNINDINLFGGYNYTFVNDDDIVGVAEYQNTNGYNGGLGFYPTSKLYISAAYNNSQSVDKTADDIQTLSTYIYYTINDDYFTTVSYAYGLSDTASDNYASLSFGVYF